MKKLILGVVLSVFGVSSAYACDGMKGHEKADKGDQAGSQTLIRRRTARATRRRTRSHSRLHIF